MQGVQSCVIHFDYTNICLLPGTQIQILLTVRCFIASKSIKQEVIDMLEKTGFSDIAITPKVEFRSIIKDYVPCSGAENYVVLADIQSVVK